MRAAFSTHDEPAEVPEGARVVKGTAGNIASLGRGNRQWDMTRR